MKDLQKWVGQGVRVERGMLAAGERVGEGHDESCLSHVHLRFL